MKNDHTNIGVEGVEFSNEALKFSWAWSGKAVGFMLQERWAEFINFLQNLVSHPLFVFNFRGVFSTFKEIYNHLS